jgi:predicted AAA+ superfamily ATPase
MTERYCARDIAGTVLQAIENMPVVVVTGMRQTGKSTFLQKQPELSGRRYVSLDDFNQLEAARRDPDGFVDTGEPITIDEAQKCPELLVAIKRVVDKKRIPGQFLLSGSSNFSMLKGVSESLAGRAVYFVMHPFNRREIAGTISTTPFLKRCMAEQAVQQSATFPTITKDDIIKGGMPTVAMGWVENRPIWFKGYEQTYLERDVRELSQVSNIIAFRHLLRLAALRTGKLLSPSELGRDAKLSAATVSRYIDLLEASFVIYRVRPFLNNRASRLIKSAKLYMSDSGIACHLTGLQDPPPDDTFMGGMLETYVAQNLISILDATWPAAGLHFWNIQGRHEVDFVIENGTKCLALEIKSATRWHERDLSGLKAFLSATPDCVAGILAYNGRNSVRLGERLWAVPLGQVLS